MEQQRIRYNGKDFALRGEKNRFVLPASLRKDVIASNSGERNLYLARHHSWNCLIGFGKSYIASFDDLLDREEEKAIRLGREYDRDTRAMLLFGYAEVPFDPSGRFVLNDELSETGAIVNELFFHGAGDFITLWNPDQLEQMGPEFDPAKVSCRRLRADALGKRK